eukprot:13809445-Heterocapsa_arctica.AAC.1
MSYSAPTTRARGVPGPSAASSANKRLTAGGPACAPTQPASSGAHASPGGAGDGGEETDSRKPRDAPLGPAAPASGP